MRRLELAQDGLGVDRADVGEVDRPERIDHLRALLRGQQRRVLGGRVGVRGDVAQQRAADLFRAGEILDVSVVKRVERAVHHRHFLPVLLEILVSDNHVQRESISALPRLL